MAFLRHRFSVLLLVLVGVLFLAGCKNKNVQRYETTLSVWGVFDNETDYSDINRMYSEAHEPVSRVQYRKFTVDTYKEDLIDALASGNNPDIFMIHSTWLPDFVDKISPAPQQILDANTVVPLVADVVATDTIVDGVVYGAAPSLDSLSLYYNKDIFNSAGITAPPATWSAFDDVVKALTRIDANGQITQAGATFGTANNVNRPMDLLSVLMMQGGAEMSDGASITFDETVRAGSETLSPGKDALLYYSSFARGGSRVYTWNQRQDYSIDAFTQGRAAMTISYSYHYNTIRAKNEQLNFAVAPLPQIDNETLGQQVNYPSYWMFVVAKNHSLPAAKEGRQVVTNELQSWESWQYIKAITYGGKNVAYADPFTGVEKVVALPQDLNALYLEKTGKPPARKDLIASLRDDPLFGPFVRGNLIARSWQRRNSDAIDQVLADMITAVNAGSAVDRALQEGSSKAQQIHTR